MSQEEENHNIVKQVEEPEPAADEGSQGVFCRFCWDNSNTVVNPLLCPCKCSGGVGYVHYTCLKHWVKQKQKIVNNSRGTNISFKQFSCEICKN